MSAQHGYSKAKATRRRLVSALASFVVVSFYITTSAPLVGFGRSLQVIPQQHTQQTAAIPGSKPNILLLMLDQWRYDWDGMHNTTSNGESLPLKMPFLKSVADRGTRFTQAYIATPLCAPVRACLAAGKEYDHSGVLENSPNNWPIKSSQTTIYKLLRDQGGYHTMSVGKDDLYHNDPKFHAFPGSPFPPEPWDVGFSDMRRSASKDRVLKEGSKGAFDLFRKHLESHHVTSTSTDNNNNNKTYKAYDIYQDCYHGKVNDPTSQCNSETFTDDLYPDDFVRDSAIDILQNKPPDKPWFLQVNFPGPHPPVFVTSKMASDVRERQWPKPVDANQVWVDYWKCPDFTGGPQYGGRCNYGGELERLDALMKSIVEKDHVLQTNNTIVCITGDHGEMLGDHNMGGKKVPWQPSIMVPLVCMGPGIIAGKVYSDPVATLDLGGTFLELAGVAKPDDKHMTTESLLPVMTSNNKPLPREVVHTGLEQWRAVIRLIDGVSWKLVCCIGDCPNAPSWTAKAVKGWNVLLYDTEADPDDMASLHREHPEIVGLMSHDLPKGWCPLQRQAYAKPGGVESK